MKKSILKTILFLLLSIVTFSADYTVGLLVNEKYGKKMEDKVRAELKNQFKDTGIDVKVKSVEYVNSDNFKNGFEKLNSNNGIETIFVLDYQAGMKNLKSDKFVIYPFSLEDNSQQNSGNIVFIQGKLDVDSDLKELKGLRQVDNLLYVVSSENITNFDKFSKNLTEIANKNSINAKVVSTTQGNQAIIDQIKDYDAIYVISSGNVKEILNSAVEQNKMTYLADFGMSNVENSMISYEFTGEVDKRVRSAVNTYANRVQGRDELSIISLGNVSEKRIFNKNIARSMNVFPTGKILKDYRVVGAVQQDVPVLELENAIKYGLDHNPSLLAAFNRSSSKDYGYRAKFAERLPQVDAEADYEYLEQNAVNNNTFDENSVTGGIKISQVIFSNDLNAQIYTQKINSLNAELSFKEESDLLIQEITDAYLSVLREKSRLSIQQSNYDMLKEFLKISRLKFETGSVGKQDVYRLEAELADSETILIAIEAALKNSEVNLNKIINLKQDTPHRYETLDALSTKFSEVKYPVKEMSYNDAVRAKIGEYFIAGALKNSNNLKIAENNILDIDNQYKAVSRSRYLPEVEGFARYNKNNIGESGTESHNNFEDTYWTAGVGVTLPLFTSGEIHYKKKSLAAERESVTYERDNIGKDVEKEMNFEINRMLAAYNTIITTETAMNSSKKYLDISINQYKVGSINITDLLEAKNTYLQSEMNNVIANYQYFNSLVAVEKTYGKYLFLEDKNEKNVINEEIRTLLKR